MICFDAMRRMGTTDNRLAEVFTAVAPTEAEKSKMTKEQVEQRQQDVKTRQHFEEKIRSRLNEHMAFSLKNHHIWTAVDLAWDSPPVNRTKIPLLLYAQGKLQFEQAVTDLANISNADKYIRKDGTGKVTGIELPTFVETEVNLIRSMVTRRLSAQSNKYTNLWPYFKYEPRGTSEVDLLRSDALSQRADIMVDQFGLRAHEVQVIRDVLLYGHCLDFVRSSWEKLESIHVDENGNLASSIEKEGICFVNPHPSRVFWDNAYPISTLNTDTGSSYVGFWDVARFGDIRNNPLYFNKDVIGYGMTLWGQYSAYRPYFTNYYSALKPPPSKTEIDEPAMNDRVNNVGFYGSLMDDTSVFKTEYFEKIIPKNYGIGDYPHPVWMRCTFASENAVIFAEFMPSSPCCFYAYNENENRQVNISFAHQLMPYQDQMTNLVTQMLKTAEADLMKVVTIDIDVIPDKQQREKIQSQLKGKSWSAEPIIVELSGSRAKDNGIDISKAVVLHETRAAQSITASVQAMAQLISLVERMEAMSPNEQGQPAPREISATEANQIAQTTTSVFSFISDGIDAGREAKKRIIYESLVACGSELRVPVIARYPESVIKKAGFTVAVDENETFSDPLRKKRTIIGLPSALVHSVYFSSKDGSERGSNQQGATVLTQLMQFLSAMPGVIEAMGKEQLYAVINEILRSSGAAVDVKLELAPGENTKFGPDENEKMQMFMQQVSEALAKETEDTAQMQQVLMQMQKRIEQLAQAPKPPTVAYGSAPPDVQRQIEQANGLTPSEMPPDIKPVEAAA
jgi:hypothetical protein